MVVTLWSSRGNESVSRVVVESNTGVRGKNLEMVGQATGEVIIMTHVSLVAPHKEAEPMVNICATAHHRSPHG